MQFYHTLKDELVHPANWRTTFDYSISCVICCPLFYFSKVLVSATFLSKTLAPGGIEVEINQETLHKAQAIARNCIKAFNAICEAVKQFIRWVKENWMWLKGKVKDFYQLEEVKKKHPQHKGRLDFTPRKIPQQVLDRRPKQFIRKIIH